MLLGNLDKARYIPRCYVVGATDRLGERKALAEEHKWVHKELKVSLRSSTLLYVWLTVIMFQHE